jgi:hypothetical protein
MVRWRSANESGNMRAMKPGFYSLAKSIGRFLGILTLCVPLSAGAAETTKPNVLFIAVDDLNHWVGHLGRNPQTKTPHIDRLARMGVTFTRAYCAAPICNPSRTALLSGRRPGATGVYDNNDPFRAAVTVEESLLMTFKKAGYTTLGKGKIWHGGLGFPEQWDVTGAGHGREPRPKEDRSIGGIKFAPLDCEDAELEDTHTANFGIEQLGRTHARPFFLALGFHKPHMPWNVPRKYFEMHPLEKIELPPYREDDLKDLPAAGVKMAGDLGDHAKVLASGRWKEAVQAYLAAISYLDAQVGRDEHDRLLLRRSRVAPGRETSLAQIRVVGGSDPRAVHLGRTGRNEAWRALRADGRFHEHLPDAVRPGRDPDAQTRRGREHSQAARRPAGRVELARRHDARAEQSRRAYRAVALHSLRRRRRRALQRTDRPFRVGQPRRCGRRERLGEEGIGEVLPRVERAAGQKGVKPARETDGR